MRLDDNASLISAAPDVFYGAPAQVYAAPAYVAPAPSYTRPAMTPVADTFYMPYSNVPTATASPVNSAAPSSLSKGSSAVSQAMSGRGLFGMSGSVFGGFGRSSLAPMTTYGGYRRNSRASYIGPSVSARPASNLPRRMRLRDLFRMWSRR